jgi:CHAD domain-containing protein
MTAARPRKAKRVAVRPSMDAATAMRAVLREALAHVEANAAGAAVGDDAEFLHQLRVGARRLRAALRASKRLWRKDDVGRLRRDLRALAAASGPARDWDVQHERLPARMRRAAQLRRSAARDRLRRVLAALDLRLPHATAGAAQLFAEFARETLERMHRKLRRRARDTNWKDPEQRHALRVRLRRLRYIAEFLAPAFPRADARPR